MGKKPKKPAKSLDRDPVLPPTDEALDQFFKVVPIELGKDVQEVCRSRLRQAIADAQRCQSDQQRTRTKKQLLAELKKLRRHLIAANDLLLESPDLVAQLEFEGSNSGRATPSIRLYVRLDTDVSLAVRGRRLVETALSSIAPVLEIANAAEDRIAKRWQESSSANAADESQTFYCFALMKIFASVYGPPPSKPTRNSLWGSTYDEAHDKGSAIVEFIRVGLQQLGLPSDGRAATYRLSRARSVHEAFQKGAETMAELSDKDKSTKS